MIGRPDPDLVSTSYVERSDLTLRMQTRRFTRLTNAFSKKAENHAHAVSLFFLHYNSRPHQTLTKAAQGVKTTGWDGVDYAMLIKLYGPAHDAPAYQRRYSPPEVIGTERHWVMGDPDDAHVSTSFAERQNLTMRMNIRRLTRLTNGFSKKLENHGVRWPCTSCTTISAGSTRR
jgi:IS1 family transposase